MSESKIYPVPQQFAKTAHINSEQYEAMYQQSLSLIHI